MSFRSFCVVGLGNHARTKLIPALIANGQSVVGLVSRRGAEDLPDAPVFPDVGAAHASLPVGTVFVIASPPMAHFGQVAPLLSEGRDVIVEKPAFISRDEVERAGEAAARSGSVLVEAFMQRHTNLHGELVRMWREGEPVRRIEIEFLIPEMPTVGTFRHGSDIAASSLYDMGCYPLSLLTDLGVPLEQLEVRQVDHAGDPARESVCVGGRLADVEVDIRIGVGPVYANKVVLETRNGDRAGFSPFFYGRAGDRRIESGATSRLLPEGNAFEAMFAVERSAWLSDQPARIARMIEVATALERLGGSLATFRRNADS
ncbi:MAG: Gfo/Idh/MocA family oxidoreductase [Brevundimonas sp.]|nr:Gfo/Idh/MocA family oxidoreductase [Brevundimonas sp.]